MTQKGRVYRPVRKLSWAEPAKVIRRQSPGMTGISAASSLDVHGLSETATNGWVVLAVVLTVASAVFVGWLLVKFSTLPGTTGAWGSLAPELISE
ncbi:hypothetical protein GA566_19940 [Cupriavidus sp. SW-Y-13]|nr:hypothetical protein [Cupriavidus sp. SW-Y-13]